MGVPRTKKRAPQKSPRGKLRKDRLEGDRGSFQAAQGRPPRTLVLLLPWLLVAQWPPSDQAEQQQGTPQERQLAPLSLHGNESLELVDHLLM